MSLPPISVASITIGFISFTFTALTLLRVFWSELESIRAASHEVHEMLGALRQELYEERDHLRQARRKCRHTPWEEETLRLMSDALRGMIRDFKRLERPFLRYGVDWDPEKEGQELDRVEYRVIDLGQRILWTAKRGEVKELLEKLSKLQIRRIGKQVDDMASAMKYVERTSGDIDDTVITLNEKLSRVIGIRRVG